MFYNNVTEKWLEIFKSKGKLLKELKWKYIWNLYEITVTRNIMQLQQKHKIKKTFFSERNSFWNIHKHRENCSTKYKLIYYFKISKKNLLYIE